MAEKQEKPKMRYSKFEIARMIGSRALQISSGAPFMMKLSDAQLASIKYNPVEIAKLEFEQGVLPLEIKRPMPKDRNAKKEAN